jgi:hypothetical protein
MKFWRGEYRVLVKRSEGRLRGSWENDIKIDDQGVGQGGMTRIELNDLYSSNREE